VPLALSVGQSLFARHPSLRSFVSDFAVHARSLVAVPLLVLADSSCGLRLGAIASHFVDADLVPERQRPEFDAAVASTQRLGDSILAELVAALLSYSIVLSVLRTAPEVPTWQQPFHGPLPLLSLAGWWHALVSVPLLLMLMLGWLWRVLLWARFLWLVSRLELRLVPSHPDRLAGLKFVGFSLRAFAVLGFAFGAIVAGTLGNRVIYGGASLLAYKVPVLGFVAFIVVLFGAPPLVFSRNLIAVRRRGIAQYGSIAGGLGREFERKWFGEKRVDEESLQVEDFSALTDLYQVASNVYQLNIVPVDYASVVSLSLMTLLPFAPILLVGVPFEVIVKGVAKLLF
jgi:hypothetical protein